MRPLKSLCAVAALSFILVKPVIAGHMDTPVALPPPPPPEEDASTQVANVSATGLVTVDLTDGEATSAVFNLMETLLLLY